MISACARTCGDTFSKTGYASPLVPDALPGPSPFASVAKVTIVQAWGTILCPPQLHWGFGFGPTHNRFGSCVNVAESWTREMFASLRERNWNSAELLATAHVHVICAGSLHSHIGWTSSRFKYFLHWSMSPTTLF